MARDHSPIFELPLAASADAPCCCEAGPGSLEASRQPQIQPSVYSHILRATHAMLAEIWKLLAQLLPHLMGSYHLGATGSVMRQISYTILTVA